MTLRSPNYSKVTAIVGPAAETRVVAVDGGPCSGKSSVLAGLEAMEFSRPVLFIPELATKIGEELLARGTNYPKLAVEDRGEYLRYQRRIVHGYITEIEAARAVLAGTEGVIVTDRSPAGVQLYMKTEEWDDLLGDLGSDRSAIMRDYTDEVIFLESLAVSNPAKYERLQASNPLRTEDIAGARDLHERALAVWEGHESITVVGGDDVDDKITRVAAYLAQLLPVA